MPSTEQSHFFNRFAALASVVFVAFSAWYLKSSFSNQTHPAMATLIPASLPRSIFNPALYAGIQHLWFRDLAPNATTPSEAALHKWFGIGSAESKAAFDRECRDLAKPALDELGPKRYPLPTFTSFEEDRRQAAILSKPLRALITEPQDSSTGLSKFDVSTSLVLLLDQLPRNVFRDDQALIYSHYDRLSRALVYCMLLPPATTGCSDVAGMDKQAGVHNSSPARRNWLYMPLMHSEYLKDHDLFSERTDAMQAQCREAGDDEAAKFLENNVGFEKQHRELIERFGRYPHRNAVLGRKATDEEDRFLADGGATFGTG